MLVNKEGGYSFLRQQNLCQCYWVTNLKTILIVFKTKNNLSALKTLVFFFQMGVLPTYFWALKFTLASFSSLMWQRSGSKSLHEVIDKNRFS